jgi:RNase P/RNase MRP subunit POP5
VAHNRHYIRVALRAAPEIRSDPVAIVANLLRPVRGGIKDARRGLLRQYRTGRF